MIAGIIGDTIGSVYEAHQWKTKDLPLIQDLPVNTEVVQPLFKKLTWVRKNYSWTDDTLCTLALYSAYINKKNPAEELVRLCKKYIAESIGFGKAFTAWLDNPIPYGSFANGSIMRIGFIPYLDLSLNEKLKLGFEYTSISHNHSDAYQAVNDYIVLSELLKEEKQNNDFSKTSIKNILLKFNFNKTIEDMHKESIFEMNALQTFLQSCVIILESNSIEEILKNSFYVGGDSDTLACISSNLGAMLYETPKELIVLAEEKLEPYEDLNNLYKHFKTNYSINK